MAAEQWPPIPFPTLLESACTAILKYHTCFFEVRHGVSLSLKPTIRIPIRASDVLLDTYIRNTYPGELQTFLGKLADPETYHNSFISVFFNENPEKPENCQTRLTRAHLEELGLPPKTICSLIRSHPDLEELNLNVVDPTGSVIETIWSCAKRLKMLNFQDFQTVFTGNLDDLSLVIGPQYSQEKPSIYQTPELRSLGIKRRAHNGTLTNGFLRDLLKPMKHLQHLDLTLSVVTRKRNHADLDEMLVYRSWMFPNTLISLCLHGVELPESCFRAILALKKLRYLDVSQVDFLLDRNGVSLRHLNDNLPELEYLDVSRTNLCDPVDDEIGTPEPGPEFLASSIQGLRRRAKPLQFLGLFQCHNDPCKKWQSIPALQTTGDATEDQIITSLKIYMYRQSYALVAVSEGFALLRFKTCTKPYLIIKLILDTLFHYPSSMEMQQLAREILVYLVSDYDRLRALRCDPHFVHEKIIRGVVMAMRQNPKEDKMIETGCQVLRKLDLPKDILFLFAETASVMLNVAQNPQLGGFAIYCLSRLAGPEVEIRHRLMLGELKTVEVALDLIKNRLRGHNCDTVMELCWNVIGGLTDETPPNCLRFLDHGGLGLAVHSIEMFPDSLQLLGSLMVANSNVSEVENLLSRLLDAKYINVFCSLLDSSLDGIEISFYACAVLSNICSDGPSGRTAVVDSFSFEDIQTKIKECVDKWPIGFKRDGYTGLIPSCRTLDPFFRLIPSSLSPASQHWACWALANLTEVNAGNYCPLLMSSMDDFARIKSLIGDSSVMPETQILIHRLLLQSARFTTGMSEEDLMIS